MATVSGKKGKKTKKNNKLSLGEFLTDGNTAVLNQVQVAVPVKLDWGDDGDDDDDDRVVRTQVIALPTAPRASRILNDDSIPQNPPYSIYVSNLPYDINENDLYDIFENVEIVSMTLPRDDSETWRLRGFGNIEFATRNDLMAVLAMPEPMVRNRRIRIGLMNENESKRRNNRYDNFSSGDSDRPSSGGNWRDRPESASRPMMDRDRDRDGGGGMRRPYSSGGGDRYGRDRDDRERPSAGDSGNNNWRSGDRPVPQSPRTTRNYDRDRDSGNGFRRAPDGRGPLGNGGGGGGMRREPEVPMERPKLVLQPRTLPLPELPKPRPIESDDETDRNEGNAKHEEPAVADEPPKPKPTPVPAAKVFGDAKPVDTAAREREIEERLQLEELLRRKKEEAAAEEKNKRDAENQDTTTAGDSGEKSTSARPVQGGSRSSTEQPPPVVNWRVRNEDDKGKAGEERVLSPARRFSPSGRYQNSNRRTAADRRTDNRDQRDNRGMNRPTYSNGVGHNRDHDRMDRGGRDHRTQPSRDTYRNGEMKDRRDVPKPVEKEKEREPKILEERMPKFQEPTGPNLQMKNTFEGLSADEIDD
ncbi:eukaryotic translation initiation factor 4B isoform X2 [Anopheles maculipalpis]|uniref:eukaryotic translation initiation factor 4B isoform X2 n=1 Tax=Anopheles maculipalpis TaxID=1496333 RepID=UPI00215905A9|nr:eukaryotic translation initiation factor 4B isoform X2 [Anopheles maculipalpis]